MTVSSIGQGPGSVVTLPGLQTGSVGSLTSVRDRVPANGAARSPESGPKSDASVVRLAWFDMNGDGVIDNRSSIAGGDGTLIVNKHASHPELSHRVARRFSVDAEPQPHDEPAKADGTKPAPEPQHTAAPVVNDVQTRQAISAYQRYGQSTSDAPRVPAVA
jgi:hypothetical protein